MLALGCKCSLINDMLANGTDGLPIAVVKVRNLRAIVLPLAKNKRLKTQARS